MAWKSLISWDSFYARICANWLYHSLDDDDSGYIKLCIKCQLILPRGILLKDLAWFCNDAIFFFFPKVYGVLCKSPSFIATFSFFYKIFAINCQANIRDTRAMCLIFNDTKGENDHYFLLLWTFDGFSHFLSIDHIYYYFNRCFMFFGFFRRFILQNLYETN